ncbi:hypothetical protein FORC48_3641 [Bacillus cereus]|uniref:protein-export chaperone SecB n=1 Tax=Bacillus cereus TaxID=1396 RepID=UPI000B59F599|nr:protein-export chaperone SecB [Bacillus cereus]ASI84721.1 hypothetical protein FORC48_3641 [Bacillus cereus]
MKETMEYYKIIRYHIQLKDVRLISLQCKNFITDDTEEVNKRVSVKMTREVKLVNDRHAEILLHTKVGFKEEDQLKAPFSIDITYGGLCYAIPEADLTVEEFEQYAYDQVVPLLLPYVRECVSNNLARMQLPIFYLPTMDVIKTMESNKKEG